MNVPRLATVAAAVRAEIVEFAIRTGVSLDPTALDGACAIASYVLCEALLRMGVDARFLVGHAYGHAHCWVEVGPWVVDITATQFGEGCDDVEIGTRGGIYVPETDGYRMDWSRFMWSPGDCLAELDVIVDRVAGAEDRRAA